MCPKGPPAGPTQSVGVPAVDDGKRQGKTESGRRKAARRRRAAVGTGTHRTAVAKQWALVLHYTTTHVQRPVATHKAAAICITW